MPAEDLRIKQAKVQGSTFILLSGTPPWMHSMENQEMQRSHETASETWHAKCWTNCLKKPSSCPDRLGKCHRKGMWAQFNLVDTLLYFMWRKWFSVAWPKAKYLNRVSKQCQTTKSSFFSNLELLELEMINMRGMRREATTACWALRP